LRNPNNTKEELQMDSKKMFSITNHQGNANQNYNSLSSHPSSNSYYQKDRN
jgi:hypothetical protein